MASEPQTFDLATLVIDYWQLIVAVIAATIAIRTHRQNRELHSENADLLERLTNKSIMSEEKLEMRRSLERRQSAFRDKSEPLRNKLSLIIMGTAFPKITRDDYLPASHLFEDGTEEADFILYCEDYIKKQFDYGIEGIGRTKGNDPETEIFESDLMNIAEQIEILLDRQI